MKKPREIIYDCIANNLNIDVSKIPIKYVDEFEFYKCIKNNYKLNSATYDDLEQVKRRYQIFCEITPGLYKWKEKTIFIKKKEKFDFSLLLVELLHAKSITQGKNYIEDWIREGLIHYIARFLCFKCTIPYKKSAHRIYFQLWEKIHSKYNMKILTKIVFTNNLGFSIELLKNIFKYNQDDILTISFERAISLL